MKRYKEKYRMLAIAIEWNTTIEKRWLKWLGIQSRRFNTCEKDV